MAKKLGIPSINTLNTMLDSVEFVKKAWSSFNLPSSLAPTMDVDELDKRIADLKAVEQWLNVNLSMLRGTIQGLEVQRGTVAAIQAFGRAMTGSNDALAQIAQAARASPSPPAADLPPAGATAQPAAPPAATGAPAASTPVPAPAENHAPPHFTPLTLPSGTQMVNPAAWWNLLQGQFNQVAQAAMSGVAQGHGGGKAAGTGQAGARPAKADGTTKAASGKRAARPARKPAAKAGTRTGGRSREPSS